MPIFDLKCPKCNSVTEHFLWHAGDKRICPDCQVQLEVVFTSCKIKVLNRSKPGSFQFNPAELDADKDMVQHFRLMEEQGKTKKPDVKEEQDYWYPKLKHLL